MSAAAKLDPLPDRLGPVVAKELRQGMRRTSFVAPFLGVQALAAMATWLEFQTGASGYGDKAWFMNLHMLFSAGPFWLVCASVCMVLMPLAGLQLMTGELDAGNHELLHMAGVSRWEIVRGKFFVIWGLCALTLASLLPYIVVRYFVGGIEWPREAACAATVLGGAALMAAGAIGASSFRHGAARIGVLVLFLTSSLISGSIAMVASIALGAFTGWPAYHLNAALVVACMVIIGLGLARARLRIDHMPYEAHHSTVLLIALVALPFLTIVATLMTCALGVIAHVFAALVALRRDRPYAHAPGTNALPPPPLPAAVSDGGNKR